MKLINIGKSGLITSEIRLGCMRITGLNDHDADTLIQTALDVGIDFFDHKEWHEMYLAAGNALP